MLRISLCFFLVPLTESVTMAHRLQILPRMLCVNMASPRFWRGLSGVAYALLVYADALDAFQ